MLGKEGMYTGGEDGTSLDTTLTIHPNIRSSKNKMVGMESRMTVWLACVAIAVAIGQWLIAPDAISYGVRFAIVLAAIVLAVIGLGSPVLIVWQRFRDFTAKTLTPNRTIATVQMEKRDETELDRSHNRRALPLRIEFSEDGTYRHVGQTEGVGLNQGEWQKYKVAVQNTTNNEIQDVQVWLTAIKPVPHEVAGHIPLPLHVTHASPHVHTMTLTAQERRLVDVVSFFNKFWQPNILLEHTSEMAKRECYHGDDGYEIELMVKGTGVRPSRRRFQIGVEACNLIMKSLDQPEEEAMIEAFET
jgi:hypothetical protein